MNCLFQRCQQNRWTIVKQRFFSTKGAAFKEPSDANRFKTTCINTIKGRAKVLMQKGIHSNSHDPQDKEHLSRVEDLTLKLFEEIQEYEDSKVAVSMEAAAKKQQIKNKSDATVPPPLSLAGLHEKAVSTVDGRRKVFSSLTTPCFSSAVNDDDDDDCKVIDLENKPRTAKKLKSETSALGDEGGSFRKIKNQLTMGVTGNSSDDWGTYLEIKKEAALVRLQIEKREAIYKEIGSLTELHKQGAFTLVEFTEKRDALLATLPTTKMG